MQVIVLLHECHIRSGKDDAYDEEINEMPGWSIRDQNQTHGDCELQQRVDCGHDSMFHSQLVSHQLIGMLPVCLAEILMEHDAVNDGKEGIDTVYCKENDICEVSCFQDQPAKNENYDKCGSDASDISCKTFCLSLRTEVEEAEHQVRQNGNND